MVAIPRDANGKGLLARAIFETVRRWSKRLVVAGDPGALTVEGRSMGTRSKKNSGKRVTCLRQSPVSEAVKLSSEVSTLRLVNERLGHEVDALRATVATYNQVAEARAASTEVQAVEGAIKRMADELTAVVERVTTGLQSSVADAIRLGDEYGTLAKSALSSARSVKSGATKAVELVIAAGSVERGQLERAIFERDELRASLTKLVTREGLAPAWLLVEFEKIMKMAKGDALNKAKVRFVERVLTWALNQRARAGERPMVQGVQDVQPVVEATVEPATEHAPDQPSA